MLELITDAGNVGIADINNDYFITHKYDGRNTLHFEVYTDDPIFAQLAEEALIYETTEGQTYLVKGINAGQTSADIDCEIDLDDWRKDVHLTYYNNTSAIAVTMAGIAPDGWAMAYDLAASQRRSVNLDSGGTPLDIAITAQDSYSCAMQFDTAKKTCTVYYPQSNPVSDTVLTESAAMRRRPEYTGKSTDLVTRIYPVGADGLTIESVNNGKNYVECHDYTDKTISQVWKDERYENPESLLEDAQKLVDALAVPEVSWQVDLLDLYRAEPQKWRDHRIGLYQRVQVSYNSRLITALVVEEELHPHHPENNTVCINSVPGSTISTLAGLEDSIHNPNSAYNSANAAAMANATKLITGSRGGRLIIVTDEDGKPIEQCVLSDADRLENAMSLWRWNEGGLGHSNSGYNGPYSMAMTKDGAIVADRVTTGTLNANIIKAGILGDAADKNYWNMETGEFKLSAAANISEAMNQQNTVNALTDNGAYQGIWLSDGRLYFNGDYIRAGTIEAETVAMSGKFRVYNGRDGVLGGYLGYVQGSTITQTTDGIGITDATGECWAVATNEGVRMQAGNTQMYIHRADGNVYIKGGNLVVSGSVTEHAEYQEG